MNNEMLLMQARQDFIDVHKRLVEGEPIPLERYERIAGDLQRMDDVNVDFILDFVKETEQIDIRHMWTQITAYIEEVKEKNEWTVQKRWQLEWENETPVVKPD